MLFGVSENDHSVVKNRHLRDAFPSAFLSHKTGTTAVVASIHRQMLYAVARWFRRSPKSCDPLR